MSRTGLAVAIVLLAASWIGPVWGVPPGFTLEFDGNGEGRVIFEGARHTGPGMHCSNCHMEIFYVSRNAQITRADHKRRQFCFVCHNGERAFAARQNCSRCHEEEAVIPAEPVPVAAVRQAAQLPSNVAHTKPGEHADATVPQDGVALSSVTPR